MEGVTSATVKFANEKAHVQYDEKTIDSKQLEDKVRSIGYDVLNQ